MSRIPCAVVLFGILIFVLVGVGLVVNVVNAPSIERPLSEFDRQSTQIAATNAVVAELLTQTNIAATRIAETAVPKP